MRFALRKGTRACLTVPFLVVGRCTTLRALTHAGDRLALDHRRRHRQRQPRRGVVGQLDRAALELGGDDLRRSDERLPTGAPGGCRLGLKLLAVR